MESERVRRPLPETIAVTQGSGRHLGVTGRLVLEDGITVELAANIGTPDDVDSVLENGAEGIGLFRTELQFMVAATFPRAEQQEKLYREVLDAAGEKPAAGEAS